MPPPRRPPRRRDAFDRCLPFLDAVSGLLSSLEFLRRPQLLSRFDLQSLLSTSASAVPLPAAAVTVVGLEPLRRRPYWRDSSGNAGRDHFLRPFFLARLPPTVDVGGVGGMVVVRAKWLGIRGREPNGGLCVGGVLLCTQDL